LAALRKSWRARSPSSNWRWRNWRRRKPNCRRSRHRPTARHKTRDAAGAIKAAARRAESPHGGDKRQLSAKSTLAVAITYALKRWPALTRYCEDGRLEIDNLIAERALRGVAIGRRNWLFAGSKAGGERAAAIYSIIETCKLNGVEPFAYISGVMQKIAEGWPNSRIDELMPWVWSPVTQQQAA